MGFRPAPGGAGAPSRPFTQSPGSRGRGSGFRGTEGAPAAGASRASRVGTIPSLAAAVMANSRGARDSLLTPVEHTTSVEIREGGWSPHDPETEPQKMMKIAHGPPRLSTGRRRSERDSKTSCSDFRTSRFALLAAAVIGKSRGCLGEVWIPFGHTKSVHRREGAWSPFGQRWCAVRAARVRSHRSQPRRRRFLHPTLLARN